VENIVQKKENKFDFHNNLIFYLTNQEVIMDVYLEETKKVLKEVRRELLNKRRIIL